MNTIAVDAMGGDGAPKKIIDGIIHNHKSSHENFFKIFELSKLWRTIFNIDNLNCLKEGRRAN